MEQKIICPHCKAPFKVPSEAFNTAVSCPACKGSFNPMKEYVKASWELTKTPEFRASLEASVAEANRNISHAGFAAGAERNTMGFKCMVGEPAQFLSGARKTLFTICVLLYMVAPPIFVSLLAYHYHDWRLLIGIIISFFASYAAANHLRIVLTLFFLLLCLCIGVWIRVGFSIHEYISVYVFSAFWGYVLFKIAEETQNYYALRSLIENRDLFDAAIAQNRIMIVRKDEPVA